MKNLEKSIRNRYILFISTILIVIISGLIVIQKNINKQKHAAFLINESGKQRMLSQRISKMAFSLDNDIDNTLKSSLIDSLVSATDKLEKNHKHLFLENKEGENNFEIDSLLTASTPYLNSISNSIKNIATHKDLDLIQEDLKTISNAESNYLPTINALVAEYQRISEERLSNLLNTIFYLAAIATLVLIAEFLFVWIPSIRQLFLKNKKLEEANAKISLSESKVKGHVAELSRLQSDLKAKEALNKIFIEQAPTCIAMLDNNMSYIAVSKRWITDFKLDAENIIGQSHYDVFPEIGENWKQKHKDCLNGNIDTCEEAPFIRADGSVQWIFWDMRPWYISDNNIGGIIIHTGDITHLKEKEEEKERIKKILDKTNSVARIGTWELDLVRNTVFWSKVVCEIHEVPHGYNVGLETAISFYKEGESRDTMENAVKQAMKYGTGYDIEVELVTAKNNTVWARAIGQVDFVDGKCTRLYGVFQDINKIKTSQKELSEAHTQLKAIFNSGSIAIVSTDSEGIINHFNHAAETLTGYSASEMIGQQSTKLYHLQEELEKFKLDIAKLYNKSPEGFDPQLELSKHNAYDTREWTYLRKDATTMPVQLTLSSIKNEQDQLIGYLAISTDVSEKRFVQNELLRKNKLLNFAEEITLMGNWQWDVVEDKVEWSSNVYNIFDIDKNIGNLNFESYFNFVHPSDEEIVKDYFNNIADEKKLKRFTHRIITGKGRLKTIQLIGEVITNEKEEVIEMIGTCQDISEQVMVENKFRGLLESAPDAMVIVNENGKIQLINKQAEKLFGYSAKELFEKPVDILIPKKFASKYIQVNSAEFIFDLETKEMGEEKELYAVNKEGLEIPIQINLSPLETEEGLLVSAAIRDITERKLAESKIIESKEKLEALANKLKDQNTQLADFAHITSHNLRAPVSNLNTLLHFYKDSETEEEKALLFSKFEKVIQHLTQTLNVLVEALKMNNNNSMELEEISLEDVLNISKETLYGQILKTDAKIISDFSKLSKITYNKIYLESIFLNLLSNAIKYKSEARVPEIFISSEIENGKISLVFKDNGLGIDLEKHGHKLFGLNKVFHRHPDAQGVGLFITKAQVESMGGTITASSTVGEGTTFTIVLN